MTLVNDEMRDAVGREVRSSTSFPVAESDIRRWATAVYYPDPPPALFWDAEAAAATTHKGIVAPEEFNPFAWMTAAGPVPLAPPDPDNVEKQLGITPPGLRNQMNGGVEVTYGVRMRPGDVITSVTRLESHTEKEGRLGRMLLSVLAETWTNQHDELVKISRFTLIRY